MMLFPGTVAPKPKAARGKPSREERARGRALEHRLKTSADIRDIGAPPAVVNPRRRKKAVADLEYFLRAYFPLTFYNPFSTDHRRMITLLSAIATNGGLSAFAMPRGQGKTQIVIRAAIWAVLSGRRRFPCLIGATQEAARNLLAGMSTEVSYNETLYGDFPRELHGLPQLQGDNRSAMKQLCEGMQTHPRIGTDRIIFPTIPGSNCSGARVSTCGITGNIRGQFHTLKTGGVIRPDLVIPDDPQTRDSADSAMQTSDRLTILKGDILGLSGPGTRIACAMPCTVITKNDLADQILQDKHWQGIRTKTIYKFPANLKLWDQYFEIRAESLRVNGNAIASNRFYREHRAEMDAGAEVAWEHRKDPDDISALQTAMHLWHQSPLAFAAEQQNEPVDPSESSDAPTFKPLASKLTNLPRGIAPHWAHWLTVGIDTQKRYLFYVVLASAPGFKCSVIEYGAWPNQSRSYFTRGDVHPTLESASGSSQYAGALRWGLDGLTESLCGRAWPQDGRGSLSISRVLIDSGGIENAGDVVFNFCRESKFSGVLMPSRGEGIGAKKQPMSRWPKPTDGREQMGQDWLVKLPENHRAVKYVRIDVNSWKTFMAGRAMALAGEDGSLSIFGERPEQHQMFFDHLAGERPVQTFGQGRALWEWSEVPNAENEGLDCLVMAGVAASMLGAGLKDMGSGTVTKKPPVRFSDLQKGRR